jgi:tetratricopeptide (TPR) repeat protein
MAERDRAEQARADECKEREAAEADLALARRAVDRGFTRLSQLPELKGLALEALRHDLLRQAKEFYDQLVEQRHDKPDLQAERGRAYLKLAEITEDLGDQPKAVEHARQAHDVFVPLCKDYPTVEEYQDGQAMALTIGGRNYRKLGQFQSALESLERSMELRRQLVAANSDAREYRFKRRPGRGGSSGT